jgi:TonB family protein
MANPQESQALGVAHPQGRRAHARRKLSRMTYVELGADNGGILLNLSEGGFAVQSVLALPSRDFPTLRFQVPHVQGWLTASGKIAWISESKREAGIQFTELPGAARSEICKWVSAEEQPQGAAINVAQETEDTKGDILNASEGVDTQRSPAQIGDHAMKPVRREAPASVTRTAHAEPQQSVTEAPRQDFHFTDYSMFAPAHEDDRAAWIKPEKKGMGWGGFTLLALLLSALFFVLGATVGRGTIDQWIAYVTGSSEPPTTPVKAPSVEAADNSTAQPDSGTSASAGQQASSSAASTSLPAENSGSSTAAGSETPSQPEARKLQDQQDRSDAGSDISKQKSASSAPKESVQKNSGVAARGSRGVESYAQNTNSRSYDDTNAGPVSNPNGHAILVNAPGPGSPPFFVNLSNEAVSASSTVAISAQHSILIAPRAGSYGHAQRVVIGKLVSHSDAFYPADARSKRIQGSVLLRVMIGRTGHVIGVTPVRGPNELVNASMAAVREWRYEPTYVDGDPAETQADVTFVFRLP